MRWVAVLVLVVGCYSPTVAPCHLACAGMTCPDGLACNTQGLCAASSDDLCSGDGIDAPDCAWGPISNLDACAVGAHLATYDLVVSGIQVTIDTDTLAHTPADLPLEMLKQVSGRDAAVVRLRSLSFTGPLATLDVRGGRPLIILVDQTASITGRIQYVPSNLVTTCPGAGGTAINISGAIGGGGGAGGLNGQNGAKGGKGGDANMVMGGSPGDLVGVSSPTTPELVPLGAGCPGGGGGGIGTAGGGPGAGGGAIQISARGAITMNGTLSAGGGGGEPGGGSGSAVQRGAGGGGSGGSILLEAPTLALMGANLCANGGGGGGTNPNLLVGRGNDGTCNGPAAGGAGTAAGDGTGGDGAGFTNQVVDPQDGGPGADGSQGHGGGGGGGGFGRIRINGMITNPPASSSPPFTRP